MTSNSAGTYTNSTGAVSSNEGGSGSGDTQALTVFGNPTVSVTSPKEGQKFNFGQKVIAHYTCTAAAGAPALSDCSGDASNGGRIDTSTAGAQTFSYDKYGNIDRTNPIQLQHQLRTRLFPHALCALI